MANVTRIPPEQLLQAQSQIQSIMDHVHAVVMQAQSGNDDIIQAASFSGPAAMASVAKAAEITEAGQHVINACRSLGDNLGVALNAWDQQAADGSQSILAVEL
jgi:uncharacterized protein YukE